MASNAIDSDIDMSSINDVKSAMADVPEAAGA